MFGTQTSALCRPKNFLAKVLTPEFEDIGNCGPPLSITNITVSPIPGKHPFRILTYSSESVPVTKVASDSETPPISFKNGLDNIHRNSVEKDFRLKSVKKNILKSNFINQNSQINLEDPEPVKKLTDTDQILSKEFPPEFTIPIEQANYILDMPPESINVLSVKSGSISSGDNTILHLKTSLQPFQLSFSGSIDLEFSHLSESEGSISKNLFILLILRLFEMASFLRIDLNSTCPIFSSYL
jgi:hypothetical protein